MSKQLVCQFLENISRDLLEDYQSIIRQYVGRRHGVYALYRKNKLYYVGLASNLRLRLGHHLRDRHAKTWDRFSVYLTSHDEHMKELESLVLRIASPKGNKQTGQFPRAEDLKKKLRRQVHEIQKAELVSLMGSKRGRIEEFSKQVVSEVGDPPLKPYVKKGFTIRYDLKGKRYIARVRRNGKIRFRGKLFNSPSWAAAFAAKKARNGWICWKYQRSPGEWVYIDELRK